MQPFQRNFSRTYKLHCILNSRLCNNNNSNNNLNSLTTTTIRRRNIITVEKNNQNKPKYYSSVFTFFSSCISSSNNYDNKNNNSNGESKRYFHAKKKTKKTGKVAQKKGLILENRVEKLLINEGRYNVKTNVFVKDSYGNRSEIDVTYNLYPSWWIFNNDKHYVECKNYSNHSVPLEDVSKFKSVLELNNVKEKHGIFITTSTFSPRCKAAAGNIKLINGDELKEWEKKVNGTKYKKLFLQALLIGGVATIAIEVYLNNGGVGGIM